MARVSFFMLLLVLSGCDHINLYERTANLKHREWRSNDRLSFRFAITDTTASYRLFVLFRHTNRYAFNNLWLNVHTTAPDGKVATVPYELPLATADKGWLGSGMGDVYAHRIALTPLQQQFRFQRAGTYTFTLEQIMREDPLREVLQAGFRVEKIPARP